MALVVAVVTVLAIAGLRALEYLEWLPVGKLRVRLARIALAPVVGAMFFVPSAFDASVEWFVEHTANSMLEEIQPMIDELAPATTTPATRIP